VSYANGLSASATVRLSPSVCATDDAGGLSITFTGGCSGTVGFVARGMAQGDCRAVVSATPRAFTTA